MRPVRFAFFACLLAISSAPISAIAAKPASAAPPSAHVYELTEVDSPPVAKKGRKPPIYPFEMKRQGISGKVSVEFTVSAEGEVANLKAVEASNDAFVAAALKAVSAWRFTPAQKNGIPVAARMTLPINFTVNER